MKLFCSIILILFISSFAKAEINIAVAANMKGTADLLVTDFNKIHKNIKVNIVSASSGELYQQIINGAPFQLFISADTSFPEKIVEKKLSQNKPHIYAYGQLVIAIPNSKIVINNINDITNTDIQYIAIANPKLAPYGKVAMEILNNQKLYDKIKNKIVSGNSLNDINQLVFSKSVDIAFTNKSALILQNDVKYYEIPTSLYNPIPQGMVLIKTEDKTKSTEANTFYNFIKSSEGKQILVNSGYIVK